MIICALDPVDKGTVFGLRLYVDGEFKGGNIFWYLAKGPISYSWEGIITEEAVMG